MKDYASLTLFTPYDGEVILKLGNIKIPPGGDVTVMVFHARQSLGTFFSSGKVEKIRICQIHFDPAAVSSSRTHVRFPTHELDALGDLDRIPADFSVTINFKRGEQKNPVKFPYILPERRKLDLLFQSRAEFEEAIGGDEPETETIPDEAQEEPQRPPRREKPVQENADVLLDFGSSSKPTASSAAAAASNFPKPHSLVDIAGMAGAPENNLIKEEKKPSSLLDLGPASSDIDNSPIVENIFPSEKPASSNSNILLNFGSSNDNDDKLLDVGSEQNTDDLFADLAARNNNPQQQQQPRVPQPMGKPDMNDLFGSSANQMAGNDFLAPTKTPNNVNNLMGGDLLNPAKAPAKSDSEQLIDDMLNQLNVNQTNAKPQQQQAKPNYNSSFFQQPKPAPAAANNKVPPQKANFADLLGGFTPTADNSNRTIGEMKKEEDKKDMTPEEAVIFEWTHGKSRNLRALLCSLDTVLWPNSRWVKCGMHQLVTHNDVKKMYRKAALAVHPDKQTGTDNESLSKLIFTELNDGWSKFQEDEPA